MPHAVTGATWGLLSGREMLLFGLLPIGSLALNQVQSPNNRQSDSQMHCPAMPGATGAAPSPTKDCLSLPENRSKQGSPGPG